MADGTKSGYGLKVATNCFTLVDLQTFQKVFLQKYNLQTSIHKSGVVGQYVLYFRACSLPILAKLVGFYLKKDKCFIN